MPDELELDEESQIQLLQKLAYWLIRNGRSEMDRDGRGGAARAALPAMPHVAAQGSPARDLPPPAGPLRAAARTGARAPWTSSTAPSRTTWAPRRPWRSGDFDLLVRQRAPGPVGGRRPDGRRPRAARTSGRGCCAGWWSAATRSRSAVPACICWRWPAWSTPQSWIRRCGRRWSGGLRELIPPRSIEEAKALAELGPIVLELLPGPELVTDKLDAAHVVRTACLVGGDAALPFLVRYRDLESPAVRTNLGGGWDRFDTETYADEIIRYIRKKPETQITVHSDEELAALERLGGHGWVACAGNLTDARITQALTVGRLQRLSLTNNTAVHDLEFVTRFPHLSELILLDCAEITSLAPLAGLPLTAFYLRGLNRVTDLRPLRELTRLEVLSLKIEAEWPGLDVISPEAPLFVLFLPTNAHGLTALAEFRSLGQLGLQLSAPLTDEDCLAIASLEQLRVLWLNAAEQAGLAATGIPLDSIRLVWLTAGGGAVDLRQTATAFPAMTTLHISDADVIDLAPLASHPTLKQVVIPDTAAIHNADALSDSVHLTARARRPLR